MVIMLVIPDSQEASASKKKLARLHLNQFAGCDEVHLSSQL
jgi:hypothetical protein